MPGGGTSAVVASPRAGSRALAPFIEALRVEGCEVSCAVTAAEALSLVRDRRPKLLIADEGLPDLPGGDPLALAAQVLRVDAFVSTAVVGGLAPEAFHEKSEGLGLLAQLPPEPGPKEACRLLERLWLVQG
ncbi:hypothetical protein dsx2_2369 [Desulfovibrio sp. X2]|uniref:hypothetical protein n=1 Tax=Desulfovibrio sp. X2 TaxID=941449 RepID=UPI000358F469|nr:hypothetical protein [Desulfovibrio sp. X2]EPR43518.1 hypothetical protein dsx2_2369 [Desulfovibrio sp. X2]